MARSGLALPAVALLLLAGCGGDPATRPGESVVCGPSFQPTRLTVRVFNLPLELPAATSTVPPATAGTSDPAVIKDIAAAACALPEPPAGILCPADMGPTYELRFTTRDANATVRADSFGCGFVTGLGPQRYDPRPLWHALAKAGLPYADRR